MRSARPSPRGGVPTAIMITAAPSIASPASSWRTSVPFSEDLCRAARRAAARESGPCRCRSIASRAASMSRRRTSHPGIGEADGGDQTDIAGADHAERVRALSHDRCSLEPHGQQYGSRHRRYAVCGRPREAVAATRRPFRSRAPPRAFPPRSRPPRQRASPQRWPGSASANSQRARRAPPAARR